MSIAVEVGDTITVEWTGADFDPGIYASTTIKVTSIQTEPITVIFGDQL